VTSVHAGPGGGAGLFTVVVVAAAAAGYLVLVAGQRARGRRWSRWRTASLLAGVGLLAVAVLPPVAAHAGHGLPGQMLQHLLIGMYAPLGLVLAAPVTLLLASLPTHRAHHLTRLLRSRPVGLLANPVTALALNLGGLAVLYVTPLYQATTTNALLHYLVHAHFLAAGYLFAWVIAGPDPAPHRPSVPTRIVVLGVAIAAHAVLAQLIYAGILVDVAVPDAERRAAGDLMYYGGDIAELLLALALLTTWRPARRGRRSPSATVVTSPDGGDRRATTSASPVVDHDRACRQGSTARTAAH
jgi:putative membrane protein